MVSFFIVGQTFKTLPYSMGSKFVEVLLFLLLLLFIFTLSILVLMIKNQPDEMDVSEMRIFSREIIICNLLFKCYIQSICSYAYFL